MRPLAGWQERRAEARRQPQRAGPQWQAKRQSESACPTACTNLNGMIPKAGKPVSRDEVLGKLRERIVRFAASHLAGDTAEDVAQEVLMLLHEKYGHLERLEDLVPLSLRIVRFKVMAVRRKAARRGESRQVSIDDIPLPGLDASPAEYLERKELLEGLTRAIGQLGERCRQLLRLKLAGKTFSEIQKTMGVGAINTIYTWDHRCRKRLLELMGGSWVRGRP